MHRVRCCIQYLCLAVCLVSSVAVAKNSSEIRFGVPTWPGVTVKSEVASQLIEAIGYSTMQTNASPAFCINALKNDDLDIYLGGWIPAETNLIRPAEKEGTVEVLTTNIAGAHNAIAVPKYVWDAGVRTEADLDKYAEKFDHKIYGIEPGSGFNSNVQDAIDNDRHGLGDWELVASSTSAMLSQVGRAIENKEWVVFLGWEPHWMNITYDIRYPAAVGESKIAPATSDVLTVVNPKLADRSPEVVKFLNQYVVDKDDQSKWVLEYAKKDREPSEVASAWIASNLDTVGEWLEGVKTVDGGSAMAAVRERYAD